MFLSAGESARKPLAMPGDVRIPMTAPALYSSTSPSNLLSAEAVLSSSMPRSVGAPVLERYASPFDPRNIPTRVASPPRSIPAAPSSGYSLGPRTKLVSAAVPKSEPSGRIVREPSVERASAVEKPVVLCTETLSKSTPDVIMGATEIVYSDAFITKEEFYASLANERAIYSDSLQKVLHSQVEKLKEAVSLEVHKLNARMDGLATQAGNPSQDVVQDLQKLHVRMEQIGNPAAAMARLQDLISSEVHSMRQRIDESVFQQGESSTKDLQHLNAKIDEISNKNGNDIVEINGALDRIIANQSTHTQTDYNAQAVSGLMDQMNHLNASVDTCQVRLQKLEAYEETSAQTALKLQTAVAQFQKEALIWQSNDEALQKQVDALRAIVDDTSSHQERLLAIEIYMEQTLAQELAELAQLASNPERGDGFEREVHGLLEHLSKSSESFDARLRKAEAGGSVKIDDNLKIRVDNLYTSYEIMDTRLRGLEYNRNSTSDISLEAINSRLEQLCTKQEGECMTRCHQLMEAEARWSRQYMEIRTSMEKEKIDFEGAIGKAMGPIPVLVTVEGTTELPGMSGNVDACCVVEILDKLRFQTVTKTSNLPVWEEGVQIDDFMFADSITFTVYDNHLNPNQDWPLPKGEIFGRAILHGSEVYLNGFEGRLKLFDTADDVNIFLTVRIGKLTGQVRAFRQEVESEEGKDGLTQVLDSCTDIVSELRTERDERINLSMELRDEIMGLLQEERQDRAKMCNALEAYFKYEISTFRNEQ